MDRAVFLDRDGVITQEPLHYAHRLDQLKLVPRSAEASRLLNENRFLVIVVSNQCVSGMLKRAEKELNIDLKHSFLVGDKLSDIEAGKSAGCKSIMVRTGHGVQELKSREITCDYAANDLYDAVEYILHL